MCQTNDILAIEDGEIIEKKNFLNCFRKTKKKNQTNEQTNKINNEN